MKKYYFDGSGTNEKTFGGIICYNSTYGNYIKKFDLSDMILTNNEAEYLAFILCAIECEDDVVIFGDSKLVVEQINWNWKVKADNLKSLHLVATNLLSKKRLIVKWCPREKNLAGIEIEKYKRKIK